MQRFGDLNQIWAEARGRVEGVLAGDVAAFNVELARRNVPGIVLPNPE